MSSWHPSAWSVNPSNPDVSNVSSVQFAGILIPHRDNTEEVIESTRPAMVLQHGDDGTILETTTAASNFEFSGVSATSQPTGTQPPTHRDGDHLVQ